MITAKTRIELYNNGMNDTKIAKELNVSSEAIRQWRKKNNFPINKKPLLNTREETKRMELYKKMYDDGNIGNICGVTRGTIMCWRKSRGLSPNKSQFGKYKKHNEYKPNHYFIENESEINYLYNNIH